MTIDELHDLQDKLCPNRNERGTESAPRLGSEGLMRLADNTASRTVWRPGLPAWPAMPACPEC